MGSIDLDTAIDTVEAALNSDSPLPAAQLLRLGAVAEHITRAVPRLAGGFTDPRFAACLARCCESIFHAVLRAQIHAAHLNETSASHLLTVEQLDALDALDADSIDLSGQPEYCPGRATHRDPTEFLSAWLKIDHFEAQRRIDGAHQLISQPDDLGNYGAARFPRLAETFVRDGADPRPVLSAAARLGKFTTMPEPDPAAQDSGGIEHRVTELLEEPNPKLRKQQLSKFFKHAAAAAAEQDPIAATGLFRQGQRNGLVGYKFMVLPAQAEVIESLIAQADNPRTDAGAAARELFTTLTSGESLPHPDFVTDEEAATGWDSAPLECTVPQRRLQALLNALSTPAANGGEQLNAANKKSAPRPTVIVHMKLAELLGLAEDTGVGAHGLEIPPNQLRRLLCDADVVPLVLGGEGEILDVGRAQRNFPEPMKRAIRARDRGCLVPGCTVPPERCEIHHIDYWKNGGRTSICNAACLCELHHHAVHAGMLRIFHNDGLPMVLLPRYLDPEQKLRRNSCFQRAA